MSISEKYVELVEKLEEVGVLQLEDEWAKEIVEMISEHGVFEGDPDE